MADIGLSTIAISLEDTGFTPAPVSTAFFALGGARAQHVEAKCRPGQFLTVYRNYVTPVMLAFDAVLIAVRAYILAERELDEADCWDPASRNWRDDADAALARMEARIDAMRTLSPVLPDDKPLIIMSILIRIMLRTTTPFELARANGLLTSHAVLFECTGDDLVAARVNSLLRRGRTLIDSVASMQSDVDVEGGFDLNSEACADMADRHGFDDLVEAA